MKNIHLIPTKNPSRLGYLTKKGKEVFKDLRVFDRLMPNILDSENQNLYITSDEEIEDCWVLNTHTNEVYFLKYYYGIQPITKKIILTTDQSLDGVQAIDDEFLEWFVKNPSCEKVEVVKEMYMPQSNGKISDGKITHELSLNPSDNTLPFYKIIIPKEEPKDVVLGYKTSLDAQMLDKIEPKQETLEEAAENHHNTFRRDLSFAETRRECFIAGAKYQAERMYSEKEVIAFTQWMYDYKGDINKVEELLKQFKNK
jgi:hypothetical protein